MDGLSKVLSEMTVCGCDFSALFSLIMIGFISAGALVGGIGSIRGGGTPVSWPNGTSSRFGPADLALIGGPASNGVRNAFSHDPGRGSVELVVMVGVEVATGVGWALSIFRSATCASSTRFRFIRFSSI
jgi:hypothetical protein